MSIEKMSKERKDREEVFAEITPEELERWKKKHLLVEFKIGSNSYVLGQAIYWNGRKEKEVYLYDVERNYNGSYTIIKRTWEKTIEHGKLAWVEVPDGIILCDIKRIKRIL